MNTQTYHVEQVIEQDGSLLLSGLLFPKGERVEIVVRKVEDDSNDTAWKRLSIESFFRDASEKDADYDNYCGMTYSFGDIVLLDYPFTDLKALIELVAAMR